MASVYLANVTGDGTSPETAFRPSGFDAVANACLMIDTAKGKALVVCTDDTITGTGINNLFTAADLPSLRAAAKSTNVGTTKRTQINAWCTNNGYTTLPAGAISWWDALHFIARQVNAAADLSTVVI